MLLNRKNSKKLLSLLDFVYKQGVLDAYEIDDEDACRDFIATHKANITFGLLEIGDDVMSWKEWRWVLTTWCRQARLYTVSKEYLDHITGKNYLWAVLPVAFDFYLKGIEEWLNYPNPMDIEVFRAKPRKRWDMTNAKATKNISFEELVNEVQRLCFERGRDERNIEGCLKRSCYDAFAQTIWTLTRVLPKGVIINKRDDVQTREEDN